MIEFIILVSSLCKPIELTTGYVMIEQRCLQKIPISIVNSTHFHDWVCYHDLMDDIADGCTSLENAKNNPSEHCLFQRCAICGEVHKGRVFRFREWRHGDK